MTTKRLTAEDLATIEAWANAATVAPWSCVRYFGSDAAFVAASEDYEEGDDVIAQHVTRTDAEFIAAARSDVPDLIAEVRALTAERDELRAIVEGRKVAPTDAELTAHDANGARWLVKLDGGKNTAMVVEVMAWPSSREWLLARGASRWWPIDANGPCAWPKVTP